jgi:hypothetical protein
MTLSILLISSSKTSIFLLFIVESFRPALICHHTLGFDKSFYYFKVLSAYSCALRSLRDFIAMNDSIGLIQLSGSIEMKARLYIL